MADARAKARTFDEASSAFTRTRATPSPSRHNVEIVPNLSPYAATEDQARAILDRLGALLAFARREAISVVGLGDVPEILGA